MATRQNSTNGKPKSPRIQVVLPELICEQLTVLADNESRTVSNMAKVLIQEGIKKYFEKAGFPGPFNPGKWRSTDLGWTWKIHPSKAVIAAPRSGGWPTDKLVSKSYKPGFPEEGCLLPAWVRSMLNRKPGCGIRFRKRSHTA
jgi:hypothetical protein